MPAYRWRRPWGGRARTVEVLHRLKRLLIGSPRPTRRLRETEVPKRLALPVFSADPLSSVAYATEQAMIVLFAVSIAGREDIMPLAAAIAAVLAIVVLSYRQTVRAYSTSGGAYAVAKDNLGTLVALTAAAALMIDYVLTVAVSVSAGVTAITSAYTSLASLAVPMAVFFVGVLTVVNLRGVRETGLAFAVFAYGFVVAILATIVVGLIDCVHGCPQATVPQPLPVGPETAAIGVFVVLHTFASGSTALTGIEAISNGVGAFRRPKGDNAATTLAIMGAIAVTLFLGVSYLAVELDAAPSASASVISQVARTILPGALFYAVQFLTFAILILAANSAFQGFPRLTSLLARDGFLPRAFEDLGDRLVYSNGALVLAALATLLVLAFGADVERLIQLYVVGVFTAFTLSQAGMVQHWRRAGGRRRPLAINALGAAATASVAVIVIATKFLSGAWVVVIALPLVVLALRRLHRGHRRLEAIARRGAVKPVEGPIHNSVLLYVEDVDAATHEALSYIHHLQEDAVCAIHVPGHGSAERLRRQWEQLGDPLDLAVLETNGRDPVETVIDHVRSLERPERDSFVTVVIPELMRKASVLQALRPRPARELKRRLLDEPGVAVTDVPVLDEPGAEPLAPEHVDPEQSAGLGGRRRDRQRDQLRPALHAFETRALFVALRPESADAIRREWDERDLQMPLEIVDSPFRELASPLLDQLRRVTAHHDGISVVVLPELVTAGRLDGFLHGSRAVYLKWLLQFEPRVALASVPYQANGARLGGTCPTT